MRKRDRQGDGEWERGRLTLNATLVPAMHEINYAHGLLGTSTNKLPFMVKLGKDDFLSLSSERSLTKTDLQDDCLHSPKENCSLIITKPLQRLCII